MVAKLTKRPLTDTETPVAHTPSLAAPGVWHSWADHSRAVADLAAEYAAPFGGADICRLMGYTHDAGKLCADVQDRLLRLGNRRDEKVSSERLGKPHKVEGAALGWLLHQAGNENAARVMCLANFGHHNGIPDWCSGDQAAQDLFDQMDREPGVLDELISLLDAQLGISLHDVVKHTKIPDFGSGRASYLRLEAFARMCHSALVDADYLDTSRHFGVAEPDANVPSLKDVSQTFFATYASKFTGSPAGGINLLRQRLFQDCCAAGDDAAAPKQGIYRLASPTGSGKTLASMAFALKHAQQVGKHRVIVAVPFTSITTQNAAVYRSMLGDLGQRAVLEHHSNILDETIAEDPWRRLSSYSWDAPVVVTTTVQLFESLLSNKPGRTRKLHRLAGSVIVLDEVQAIPLAVLRDVLEMLRHLVEDFGVTVLLCSATQPTFWELGVWQSMAKPYDIGRESISKLGMERVSYEIRPQQSWAEIADDIAAEDSALAIVNTTKDAQELHRLLTERTDTPVLHLSTRMCNVHRQAVLDEVRTQLVTAGQRVLLVSTQLIEAGVDVDFPCVYRAMAPAEAICQSGGRANREGRLGEHGGRLIVIQPDGAGMPPAQYKTDADRTKRLFSQPGRSFAHEADLQAYFRGKLRSSEQIHSGTTEISAERAGLNLNKVAQMFRMIDSINTSVVVQSHATGDDAEQLEQLRQCLSSSQRYVLTASDRRLIQRFSAQVPEWVAAESGTVVGGITWWDLPYDSTVGVVLDAEPAAASIW